MRIPTTGQGLAHLDPWFDQNPCLAAVVVVTAYAGLSVWGLVQPSLRGELGVATVLPTALAAVAFGRWGGIGGGAATLAIFGSWLVVAGHDADGPSWASAAALVALGMLVGNAVDAQAASEARAREAEAAAALAHRAADRHRAATEINDRLVQEVAVAKWALESGRPDRAVAILDEAVGNGQRLVSELLAEKDAGR